MLVMSGIKIQALLGQLFDGSSLKQFSPTSKSRSQHCRLARYAQRLVPRARQLSYHILP
jgi:hypothetical protein